MRAVVSSLAFVLLVVACATVPPAQQEEAVAETLSLIDEADAQTLTEASARPFLLDGEIVELSTDVHALWRGLREGDFVLGDFRIQSVDAVDGESYLRFADNQEVEWFFEQHVGEEARLVTVRGRAATYLFLMDGDRNGAPYIRGFTGPL